MSPTLLADSPRVLFLLSTSATALATVISRPSRIHATPSATTIRVWNRDQGNRSMRAGISVRTPDDAGTGVAAMTTSLRANRLAGLPPPPGETRCQRGRPAAAL